MAICHLIFPQLQEESLNETLDELKNTFYTGVLLMINIKDFNMSQVDATELREKQSDFSQIINLFRLFQSLGVSGLSIHICAWVVRQRSDWWGLACDSRQMREVVH